MAITAAIASVAVGAAGVAVSHKAQKEQKKAANLARDDANKAKAEADEDARIAAESKAFKGMDTTKRIQMERMMASRQGGGRSSTMLNKKSSLG